MLCLKSGIGMLRGVGLNTRKQILNEARQAWTIDYKTHVTSGSTDNSSSTAAVVVYRGNLSTFIKATKLISLSSSAMGLAAQPLLLRASSSVSPTAIACLGLVVVAFTYVTPLLLHWITRKYVTEMRFDPRSRTFTATTISFFLVPKRVHFRASDVHVPDVPGLFTTFLANDRPLFVDFRQFDDIEAFRHLMGYDKPLDLKLDHKSD